MIKEITNEENDLIEAIRNYKRAYPNGQKELLRYAVMVFEEMVYG
jgi:hypothetical protein